jgi:hypothetical protein
MEFLLTSPATSSGVRHQDKLVRTKRDGGLPVLFLFVELSERHGKQPKHGKSCGGRFQAAATTATEKKKHITGRVQGVGNCRRHPTQSCIATNPNYLQEML